MRFRAKNGAIWELITLLRANQIARIVSDFKVDVINSGILLMTGLVWQASSDKSSGERPYIQQFRYVDYFTLKVLSLLPGVTIARKTEKEGHFGKDAKWLQCILPNTPRVQLPSNRDAWERAS